MFSKTVLHTFLITNIVLLSVLLSQASHDNARYKKKTPERPRYTKVTKNSVALDAENEIENIYIYI